MFLDNFLQCWYVLFIEYLVTITINTWVTSNESNYVQKVELGWPSHPFAVPHMIHQQITEFISPSPLF